MMRMPHKQVRKLVKEEMEEERSSHSSSSTCLLQHLQTPSNIKTCCSLTFNQTPPYHHLFTRLFYRKLRPSPSSSSSSHAHSSTWDRFKALCFATLPAMGDAASSQLSRPQRREELEREVCELHEMLHHEEKVHEYLEHLHNRLDDYDASISNFLLTKMNKILAELAMVENEITHLEGRIKQLRGETQHKVEPNIEKKYKEWGCEALQNHDEDTCHEEKWADREKLSKKSSLIKTASPVREPRNPTPRIDESLDVPSEYSSKSVVDSLPYSRRQHSRMVA